MMRAPFRIDFRLSRLGARPLQQRDDVLALRDQLFFGNRDVIVMIVRRRIGMEHDGRRLDVFRDVYDPFCNDQRCFAVVTHGVDVGTMLNEQVDDLRPAEHDRVDERRFAEFILNIGFGAVCQQQLGNAYIGRSSGFHQRRYPVSIGGVDVRAGLDQDFGDCRIRLHGEQQGRHVPRPTTNIYVRTLSDELLDLFYISLLHRF